MKCGVMVRHHRKCEKVKAHLNRCIPFLNSLQSAGLFDVDIPHWVVLRNDGKEKRNKVLQTLKDTRLFLASPDTTSTPASTLAYTTATAATRTSTSSTSTTPASKKPRANRTTMQPRANGTIHDYLIPPLSAIDRAAFQEEIAMNFYMCARRASFAQSIAEAPPR